MKFFVAVAILVCILIAFATAATSKTAKHNGKYDEAYFTSVIAKKLKGKEEVRLSNRKRVDIVTRTHACEVDWLSKAWSEGVGQALHYSMMTGKAPCVIALIDKPHEANLEALMKTAKAYNIKVITYHVDKKKGTIR